MPLPAAVPTISKSPHREIAELALPVSLEMVIQLVLTFINQLIVGSLGTVAVAAVGLSGSLSFLFFVTLGAVGSGTSILIARRFGAGDRAGVNHTLSVTVLLSFLLGTAMTIPTLLGSASLLRLAGSAPDVTEAALPYLRVAMLALVPGLLAGVLSGALRSLGRARTPLVATLLSVGLEVVVAYALVTGFGPLPKLGLVGAAWAIWISNVVKALFLAYQIYGPRQLATFTLPQHRNWREIVGPLLALSAPLAFTQFAWSLGGFIYNAVFARVGTAALAAAGIVGSLEGVFIVASFGLMSAATVLIGRSLGAGDGAGAQQWLHHISRLGVITGLGFGLLFGLSGLLLPVLFPKVGADVQQLALVGIVIAALTQVVKVRNMILGGGVLPSAGDGKGIIIGDLVGAFVVGLPLAIYLGLYTPLGLWGVFVARTLDELAKVMVFEWRRRRIDWDELAAKA